jgi:hypothetical protein
VLLGKGSAKNARKLMPTVASDFIAAIEQRDSLWKPELQTHGEN